MKDGYFTAGNIAEKSREMLRGIRERGFNREVEFMPERAALLVIDMQRYFLDDYSHAFVPSAVTVIPRIRKLAERFIEMERPVVLTRHLNTDRNAGMIARWWGDMISEDDPLSAIIGDLVLPGTITIRKTQYDAFYKTRLERRLRELGVTQIIIAGVMAHLCCETTTRSAFVRGFAVYFLVDGTATYDEDFHRATLLNLSHGFAVPVLTEDILRLMGE
jgi:bifunctional isochorismate lyase/aryl carrier protein